MKRNQVSAQELWVLYQKNKPLCKNVKPWSFELNGETYVVPTSGNQRTGEPLIKGAYQETNNKVQRDFRKTVASIPRNISIEHRERLDKYIEKNGGTIREAIERAIDLLPLD